MIKIIKIITILISSYIYLKMFKNFINKRNQNIIFILTTFFYIFFIQPLILDIIIGYPSYKSLNYGFIVSYNKLWIEVIYNIFVIFNMLIFNHYFKKNKFLLEVNLLESKKNSFFIFIIFCLTTILATLFIKLDSDTINKIFSYQTRYLSKTGILEFVSSNAGIFSLIILGCLLMEKDSKSFMLKSLVFLPYIILLVLVNGKKSVVFITLTLYIIIIFINKIIKSKGLFIIFAISVVSFLMIYLIYYLNNVDASLKTSFAEKYTSYRIELCRDDRVKYAIYNELYEEQKILDYRGQTILFYFTFFIRRSHWTSKPYPYAIYFTKSMIGLTGETIPLGWSMTTTIYDELISNFGLFTLLITPILLARFCISSMKNYEKNRVSSVLILLLTILLSCLSLTTQLSAHLYLALLYIGFKFLNKIKIKGRKNENNVLY